VLWFAMLINNLFCSRKLLTDNELLEIFEACDMAGDINNFKSDIYEYVESRMTFIAPNITAIVGKLK
jgi:U4/U6 small nuclear ribonucleoprotein PRP31